MNKLKKIWMENKVLLVLGIILLVCLFIIILVALTSFYGSSSDVYGNRLDVTKTTPLHDTILTEIKDKVKENESVKNVNNYIKGLVIHNTILFNDGTNINDAKKVAEEIVPLFTEEELKVYDIEITIKTEGESSFVLKGARNASGSGTVVWGNYNVPEGE